MAKVGISVNIGLCQDDRCDGDRRQCACCHHTYDILENVK